MKPLRIRIDRIVDFGTVVSLVGIDTETAKPVTPRPDGAAIESGPSIFTAIQQQLGLRLRSQKAPVEVVVIDHVERPSEN